MFVFRKEMTQRHAVLFLGFAWKILVGRGSLFRDCALLCAFAGLQNDHCPQDFKTFPFQFLIIVMQVVIALVVVFFIFNIPCDGPVLLFILLCLLQGDNYNDKKPQRSMIKTITLRRSWHELRLFSLNSLWHNRRRHEDGHKLLLPRPHGDTKYLHTILVMLSS